MRWLLPRTGDVAYDRGMDTNKQRDARDARDVAIYAAFANNLNAEAEASLEFQAEMPFAVSGDEFTEDDLVPAPQKTSWRSPNSNSKVRSASSASPVTLAAARVSSRAASQQR
jgi:hypothetical protein